jgi:D-alanyl-D-alanine carboxypeptidase
LWWSAKWFDHKLLNREYTNFVVVGKVATGEAGVKQAYGFTEEIVNGSLLVHHSGAVPGGEARLEIYPQLGYTVVSLTNYDYQVVHRRLRDMITQK